MKKVFLYALVIMLTFSFAPNVASAKTSSQLQKDKAKIQREQEAARNALANAQNQQKTLAEEIKSLDMKVTAAQNELEKVESQLAQTEANLESAKIDLENATVAREKQYNTFTKRIKYIHENGTIGYLKVVLEAKSFNDLLTRMQYVTDIMQYDKDTLAELKKNEEIITQKTIEIAEEKAKIEVLVADQAAKTKSLDDLLEQKKATALKYREDEEKYSQEIAENEKASQEVERLINQAIAAEERAAAAAANSKGSSASSSTTNFKYTGGKLQWPVQGRTGISSGYGNRSRPIGKGGEFHTGFDIPAPAGYNITAAEAGTVITAGYVNGYGYTVIINHGNGLHTLYGHNSKLTVSVGQTVTRGQVIAKCGSTGNSTGNHCHFEVRQNGKHQNPANYLS